MMMEITAVTITAGITGLHSCLRAELLSNSDPKGSGGIGEQTWLEFLQRLTFIFAVSHVGVR